MIYGSPRLSLAPPRAVLEAYGAELAIIILCRARKGSVKLQFWATFVYVCISLLARPFNFYFGTP